MLQPGRKYEAGSGYRFGFNGKENDKEVSGVGNQYDYGFRIYNPRIGRFLSVDPLSKNYTFYTPYQFASNTPIAAKDIDGLESDINFNRTEQGEIPENLEGGALRSREEEKIGSDALSIFTKGAFKTVIQLVGAATEIPARMHYGDRIRPENQQSAFPLTYGMTLKDIISAPILGPYNALTNIMNDPYNPEVWGGNLVILVPYAKPVLKLGNSVLAVETVTQSFASIQVYTKASEIIKTTPKNALPRAVTAAYDKVTGQTYYGISNALKENSVINPALKDLLPGKSKEKWGVLNCAECDALNNALNAGSKAENLQIHTVKINKNTGKLEDFNACANCAITTSKSEVTSGN